MFWTILSLLPEGDMVVEEPGGPEEPEEPAEEPEEAAVEPEPEEPAEEPEGAAVEPEPEEPEEPVEPEPEEPEEPEGAAVEFEPEEPEPEGAALARTELEAVDPVKVKSRVWTDERALLTTLMAASMLVTWVPRDFFSSAVQVTEEDTPVISAASVVKSFEGKLLALLMSALVLERISAQLVATALTTLPLELLDPARALILVFASVRALLLALRVAAFLVSPVEDWAQAMMEGMASSSYFLHTLKALLQALNCLLMAVASLLALQDLMEFAVFASWGPSQQPQASDTLVLVAPMDLLMQIWTENLKAPTSLLQLLMKVKLGWGKLAGLQDLLTLSSQSNRVLVRFWSCLAPLLP